MSQLEFTEITPDELDAFSAKSEQGNFQQTSKIANLRDQEGKTVRLLGVKDNGELVVACLLQIISSGKSTFAIIHDGPLMDYSNAELVKFFTDNVKSVCKDTGAAQLDITPEAVYRLRSQEGEPTSEAKTAIVENLKAYGWDHVGGFSVGYTAVPRWRWIKDLSGITSEDELLQTYAKYRRRNIKIAREAGVHTRKLERDELHFFHEMCELSCQKQGFPNRPLSYFESMYDALGSDIEYRVAEIHFDEYLANWQAKLDKHEKDIARIKGELEKDLNEKRRATLDQQLEKNEDELEAIQKRIEEANRWISELGTVVVLDGSMFIFHPRETICTTSGADERFAKFYAPALMHHEMMLRCIEEGISRYNLYGVNGIFTKENNPGFGVLEFKQRFNGFIEEMPGEFVLPIKPAVYKAKQLAHKLLRR